ncbi:MAG TPA: hypothetical protein VJB94_01560 [Candidatus Nanoarchaeia archaeon]|nr:hypothetical protein [Candidatus Nanoarchaeia archaeon]
MPDDNISDIGSPIKVFVRDTINQLQDALPKGFELVSNIDFKLKVVQEQSGDGGVDIKVLKLGGEASSQQTQEVSFSVGDPKKAQAQLKKVFEELKKLDEKPKKKK